jgi:hypothetical protein
MYNLEVRVREVRVLSKQRPTLKRRILEEERITTSIVGHGLSTYK